MPPLHTGAGRDPFIGGIEPGLEIVIRHDARRCVMADTGDLNAAQGHRPLSGRLFLNLDRLPAVVRSTVFAREMRTLRLVALRTDDPGDRAEFPVRSPATPRLAARGLPF